MAKPVRIQENLPVRFRARFCIIEPTGKSTLRCELEEKTEYVEEEVLFGVKSGRKVRGEKGFLEFLRVFLCSCLYTVVAVKFSC